MSFTVHGSVVRSTQTSSCVSGVTDYIRLVSPSVTLSSGLTGLPRVRTSHRTRKVTMRLTVTFGYLHPCRGTWRLDTSTCPGIRTKFRDANGRTLRVKTLSPQYKCNTLPGGFNTLTNTDLSKIVSHCTWQNT